MIFRIRYQKPAPLTAPLSSRFNPIFKIAFLSMVVINGNTCILITNTSPPREKNSSDILPVHGKSCWNNPLFCINKIQPIDAIYGGVINGIIKIISSHFLFPYSVRANKNANGVATIVETITTSTPNNNEFLIVSKLLSFPIVCIAFEKSRRPSTMTDSENTVRIGTIMKQNNAIAIAANAIVLFLLLFPISYTLSILNRFH